MGGLSGKPLTKRSTEVIRGSHLKSYSIEARKSCSENAYI
jgi:dihydroorotate dehydrogenase